jgi:hypothetical protein
MVLTILAARSTCMGGPERGGTPMHANCHRKCPISSEAHRMVTEKIAALTEAQVAAATAAVEGSSSRQVTRKVWAFQKARSSQQTKIHEIERLGKSHVRGQGRARVRNNEMLNIISRTGVVITIISLGLALSACGYNTIPTLEEQATQDACQVASRKKVLGEPLNSSLSSERVRESGPVVV